MGLTLMPWQQRVVDVALEVDESGRLAYRDVVVTVPRQSGKSTCILPVVVWRALCADALGGPQRMLYSAQSRQDARKKWRHDYLTALTRSEAMRGKFEVSLASGDEHIRFRGHSTFGIVAVTEKAGHGQTLDMAVQDEAFSLADDRMDQAFKPAMITRPQAQMWVVSTAGHAGSHYLRDKVNAGRAAVERDTGHGVAYFEWSADEDADPGDPETWWSCMPALGRTQTVQAVAGEYEAMGGNQFCRAFLNQWVDEISDSVIPLAWWQACASPGSVITGRPVFAVDVSPGRDRVSVVACGDSPDGRAQVELLEYLSSTDGLLPLLVGLVGRHDGAQVVVDEAGPGGSLVAELRSAGVEPVVCTARGMAQACGMLHDAARDGRLVHLGDPILEGALRASATRQLGDAWAWKRRTSSADISPLVAATLALWGHQTAAAPTEAWAAWA